MLKRLAQALQRLPERSRSVVATLVYGLAAGLVAVGFQMAINWVYWAAYTYPSQVSPQFFPWISLGLISATSLLAGWLLVKYCPEAAGSGIPQLKLAFWKDFGHSSFRVVWVKFIAGTLSIGGGQSLGREGPSVQLGGSIASSVATMLGVAKQNKRAAAAAGAAAGLAAAFNAPLAAVAFVLEEILEDLHSRFLGAVLLGAVVGAFVVHAVLGAQPAFELPRIDEPTWHAYLLMPLCAGIASLVGVAFQRGALTLRAKSRSQTWIPPLWRPLLAAFATWGLGMAVYSQSWHLGIFGLGFDDLSLALEEGIAWKLAAALLLAKLLATVVCYGLGGCGGIFSPTLFFGAMCGVAIASFGSHFMAITDSDRILLTVGGMSACLGGVVQAPVTPVLIIFEMTHQFALLPGLMIAGLVSQFVARRCNHENFYEAVLLQDGHQMAHVIPPRDLRSWHNLPISAIAGFHPIVLTSLEQDDLAAALAAHPYQRFPVTKEGHLKGVLLRSGYEQAQRSNRAPQLLPAVTVRPSDSVRQCQSGLIESGCGMIVITDQEEGIPLAVVTLHDLLRAQAAVSEREG